MFRGLRLRLTLLYLLAGLALTVLIGAGAYWLLSYYFQTTTDLALQHKMAHEFRLLGVPLPAELAAGDRAWYASRPRLLPDVAPLSQTSPVLGGEGEHEGGDYEGGYERDEEVYEGGYERDEEVYEGELAAIFVLPLDASNQLLFDPNPFRAPMTPDMQAAAAASAYGLDWRTVALDGGTPVRLLTYRIDQGTGPALLQLGRTLTDQNQVLRRLVVGLLGLGGISMLLLGVGSWWLAGRSLRPAQQAWERQQMFVANASHELRTPLTLIRASTEYARRGSPADEEQRALLDDVIRECDHMGQLVDDLLLLSRIDAGRAALAREAISVRALVADVQRQVQRLAGEKGVRLTVEQAGGAVWGDPTRLRQVLLILLDNALRHTPSAGTIRVTARPEDGHVQIAVADTGSGIAPQHLPHVFERFFKAEEPRGDGEEGNGLGLAIAKALVEAQGGQIRLDSEVGVGTTATLRLPRAS